MIDAKTMAQRSKTNLVKMTEKCKRILRRQWNKAIKLAVKRGNFTTFWEPENFSKYECFDRAFDELAEEYSELGYYVEKIENKLIAVYIRWRP